MLQRLSRTNTLLTFSMLFVPLTVALATYLGVLDYAAILIVGVYGLGLLIVWMSKALWRPAAVLLAVAPFQGVLIFYFGFLPNLFTWVPVAVFLTLIPRDRWIKSFTATTTQKITLVFIFAIGCSFLVSLQYGLSVGQILSLLQKLTLFFLLAVLAAGMHTNLHLRRLMTILVFSTTLYVALSLIDFYFGVSLLPNMNPQSTVGLAERLQQAQVNTDKIHHYRLRGIGDTMSINRFALWASVAFFLGVGYLVTSTTVRSRLVGVIVLVILGIGILAAGSRSGLLGVGAGLLTLVVFRAIRLQHMILIGFVSALGIALFLLIWPPEVITVRFTGEELASGGKRFLTWSFGLDLFARSPIFGVGLEGFFQHFVSEGWYAIYPGAADAHSSYVEVLAEQGLIGTVPFFLLIVHVVRMLLRTPHGDAAQFVWRRAFLAALVAVGVNCLFHSYHYERILWVAIALAVAVESYRVVAPSRVRQPATSMFYEPTPAYPYR